MGWVPPPNPPARRRRTRLELEETRLEELRASYVDDELELDELEELIAATLRAPLEELAREPLSA